MAHYWLKVRAAQERLARSVIQTAKAAGLLDARDHNGQTALMVAAARGGSVLLRLLLDAGGDVK